MTNMSTMMLAMRARQCDGKHKHQQVAGKETKKTEKYTPLMARLAHEAMAMWAHERSGRELRFTYLQDGESAAGDDEDGLGIGWTVSGIVFEDGTNHRYTLRGEHDGRQTIATVESPP